MSTGQGKTVCVTGASGYIASWLVKLLLQKGYTVKATVRDPNDPKKTEHLRSLDGAKERLHLFKADLLEEGAFDAAVDGCQGVFHTASPVLISVTDPQAELIDPAVKGTLNVLQSCAKFRSVMRVVLTSSIATVMMSGTPLTSDVVLDETWYSDKLFCEEHKACINVPVLTFSKSHILLAVNLLYFNIWYVLSKILAEEAGWKFAEGNGIDMVSMNPGLCIGPLLNPTLMTSVEQLLNVMSGTPTPFLNYPFVDVRDVASAHIQAFEVPSASGRYCLVGHVVDGFDTLKILRQLYPTLTLAEAVNPSDSKYQVSQEKAKGLGITFLPLETSVFHTALSAQFSATDPQAEIVEPAVKGTLNVLKSCAKFPSIKRVVLTSSIASVMGTGTPLASDVCKHVNSEPRETEREV
ncbi:hypothetical protein DVH24_016084 [Malus domestica]|uniref:Bifunctional dihydroflavonol 4-reductase/flavanone 4-reductase n=1 Tax=Malus domestica TaxID=3750 RepID=A0A498JGS7_MALDO|nr:hypothetical protein DVH24_016084 [Malus domestica]